MFAFTVKAMTCGGCASAITRSIKEADTSAKIKIDLSQQRVEVETRLTCEDLGKLLDTTGFPIELIRE